MKIPPGDTGGIFLSSFARVGTGAHSTAPLFANTRGAEIAGMAKRSSARRGAGRECIRYRWTSK